MARRVELPTPHSQRLRKVGLWEEVKIPSLFPLTQSILDPEPFSLDDERNLDFLLIGFVAVNGGPVSNLG